MCRTTPWLLQQLLLLAKVSLDEVPHLTLGVLIQSFLDLRVQRTAPQTHLGSYRSRVLLTSVAHLVTELLQTLLHVGVRLRWLFRYLREAAVSRVRARSRLSAEVSRTRAVPISLRTASFSPGPSAKPIFLLGPSCCIGVHRTRLHLRHTPTARPHRCCHSRRLTRVRPWIGRLFSLFAKERPVHLHLNRFAVEAALVYPLSKVLLALYDPPIHLDYSVTIRGTQTCGTPPRACLFPACPAE